MSKKINDGLNNMQRYNKKNREERAKQKREITHKHRMEILHLLSDKCSNPNCAVVGGMTDWRALQIDHVNGGGNEERKHFQNSCTNYYNYVLEQIKAGSKDYQLLCANCNWIKRHKNNEFRDR